MTDLASSQTQRFSSVLQGIIMTNNQSNKGGTNRRTFRTLRTLDKERHFVLKKLVEYFCFISSSALAFFLSHSSCFYSQKSPLRLQGCLRTILGTASVTLKPMWKGLIEYNYYGTMNLGEFLNWLTRFIIVSISVFPNISVNLILWFSKTIYIVVIQMLTIGVN